MKFWNQQRFGAAFCAAVLAATVAAPVVHGEGLGQEELDEALRAKVTAEDLRDLNKVVELLESAIDKGLDVENSDFAEQLLSESLLERASQLASVLQAMPTERLVEDRLQRVRGLAVSDLRRVMTYDDPPPHATAMLAELLAMPGGDRAEARELLDKLLEDKAFAEMPPRDQAESYTLRASLQTKSADALADFNTAVELVPDKAKFRLARAAFHREQGEHGLALADVNEVIKRKPDEASSYLLKAQIQRDQNKLDEALASVDKASELAPEEPALYQTRGEIYRAQDKLDEAIEEFSKVLQLQPGLLLALIHRAEAYYSADKLDEALADVESVLKEYPTLAVAHGLRAQVLASKDRLPEAIEEMKAVADSMPTQPEYRMQLAMYYLQDKQPRKAIEAYSEVLSLEGDHFLALRSRGDAYLNIGEHEAAVADFAKALSLKEDDSPLLNNYAWVLATSPDDAVRDGQQAIELAKKACEITKYEQPHILSTLGAAYAETGDFEKAREWSRKAVDMNKEGKDEEITIELAKELASYEENKPWRERQVQEEREAPKEESPEDPPPGDEDNSSRSVEAPAKLIDF
jgi:tetratricopeptide (TPR) repeat protein